MARTGRMAGIQASHGVGRLRRRAEYADRSSLGGERDGILKPHPVTSYRYIPSIEQLRRRKSVRELEARYGPDVVVEALRAEAAALRARLATIPDAVSNTGEAAALIESGLTPHLERVLTPSLRPVINATGVIVHTNLGRAPLARAAIERIGAVAAGYTNLEYDLARGARGNRSTHSAGLLTRVTGAEAATVVNNNAAAVLLVLAALGASREVIISRGELVEIGGGFRIPDVMRQSGVRLREVGTTNRTRPADYVSAISEQTALILRVHPSNFRIEGFTERPALRDVVAVGNRYRIPVVEDLGSGNIFSEAVHGGLDEPTVRNSIDTGVTVCCFSGDKLLGGPQAGIIVGRRAELDRISNHPLMRALRVDKLVYTALEATLLEHVFGRATATVPVGFMIATTIEDLTVRANRIINQLSTTIGLTVAIQVGKSAIGGGSTPGITIPSCLLEVRLNGHSTKETEARLRAAAKPVIGRIEHDRLLLDLRTVQPGEDDALIEVLKTLASS